MCGGISGPGQGKQPEKSFRGRAIVVRKYLLHVFPVLPLVFGSSNRNPIAKMRWGFADHPGKEHSFLRHTQSRQVAIPCWLQLLLHPVLLWNFMKLYIYLILFYRIIEWSGLNQSPCSSSWNTICHSLAHSISCWYEHTNIPCNGMNLCQGRFRLDIKKQFLLWGGLDRGTGFLGKWSQHQVGQSKRNIWTMLSGTCCDSWCCPMLRQE